MKNVTHNEQCVTYCTSEILTVSNNRPSTHNQNSFKDGNFHRHWLPMLAQFG